MYVDALRQVAAFDAYRLAGCEGDDPADIYCQSFACSEADGSTHELLPRGDDVEVDVDNVAQFVQLLVQHRLGPSRTRAEGAPYPVESLRQWPLSVLATQWCALVCGATLSRNVCG